MRWIDEAARAAGVRVGQTVAAARARLATLESALVDEALLAEARRLTIGALLRWTPRVTPDGATRFWCEPVGARWGEAVRAALASAGPVRIGVGPWAAVAHAAALDDVGAVDAAFLDRARLDALELSPRAVDGLAGLGVRTVAQLRALDPVDLGVRFGPAVAEAWRRASGDDPRGPRVPCVDEPPSVSVDLDEAEIDHLEPLLFVLRPALERLVHAPRARGLGVTALGLELRARGEPPRQVAIRCAAPIADPRLLLELAHAHLERLTLDAPIRGVTLDARALAPLGDRNVPLFAEPRRDPTARQVALTRLAGRFGEDAVRRATRVELPVALARADWTRADPVRGAAVPWRQQEPPARLEGGYVELCGRRRRVVRLGRIERALAPFWLTGALRVERLAWAEVDGPVLVLLRAHQATWEAVAFAD